MESLFLRTYSIPNGFVLEDSSSDVAKINVPTLVLAGEFDQFDLIEQHKRDVVARISNARFEIIKGSDQLIPIDEPLQRSHVWQTPHLGNEGRKQRGRIVPSPHERQGQRNVQIDHGYDDNGFGTPPACRSKDPSHAQAGGYET
jgi:hypothetical protein